PRARSVAARESSTVRRGASRSAAARPGSAFFSRWVAVGAFGVARRSLVAAGRSLGPLVWEGRCGAIGRTAGAGAGGGVGAPAVSAHHSTTDPLSGRTIPRPPGRAVRD